MIKSHFLTALRVFKKQKLFTFINTLGLSIGIAFFIIATVFVRDELTYDRFHEKSDRIYRSMTSSSRGFSMGVADKLIDLAINRMPEIESVARISFGSSSILEYEGKKVFEGESYNADPEIFEIFDFSLMLGNVEDALVSEDQLIISKYIMDKYFNGENPIGKSLKLIDEGKTYTISGVLNEIPKNSRFRFNFIAGFGENKNYNNWSPSGLAYLLLNEGADLKEFDQKLKTVAKENGFNGVDNLEFIIEPFESLYLDSDNVFTASNESGDRELMSIFMLIAVVLLLIATINYINSSTARILSRVSEIGIRKVMGANRAHINTQYFLETFMVVLLAMVIAAGLVEAMLPSFNELAGKKIALDYFGDPFIFISMAAIVALVTLLAGFYPAMFAGRFSELSLMSKNERKGKGLLRKSLVVFQFVATLMLIFSSQIIHGQLNLFLTGDIGYNPKDVLVTYAPDNAGFQVIKSSLEGLAGVEKVIGSPLPSPFSSSQIPMKFVNDGEPEEVLINPAYVSRGFFETMELKLLSGRAFDEYNDADMNSSVMISETLAALLPWSDPVGQTISYPTFEGEMKKSIVGIYRDYRNSLKSDPYPIMLTLKEDHFRLNIKISEVEREETVASIKDFWDQNYPESVMQLLFLEDRVKANYNKEKRFGKIFQYFTYVAIFIAIIGLVGLSSFTIIQKVKEIGIRKVLGASVSRIAVRIMLRYIALLSIAALIAVPFAYYFMNEWLADFASRISITPFVFIIGFVAGLGILVVAVGYQTLKAAQLNPTEVLNKG